VPRLGAAFGLDLAGDFPAPGLWTGAAPASAARPVSLEIVPHAMLERPSPGRGWEPLRRQQIDRDGRMLALDEHREHGYWMHVDGFGSHLIARDGRRILMAPAAVEPWRWQRLLTAQVLPIAALAQGVELFHASAVALGSSVLAFTGRSGAGKTTLASQLMIAGATFVCDDALAVEQISGDMIAHPGPALMNLRDCAARPLSVEERGELGTDLGCDEAGPRLLVRRKATALPLRALYVLRRRAGSNGGVLVNRLSPPKADLLLGAGFATALRPSARLIRRLDLCAQLAARTAVFAIEAPAQAGPKVVADAVLGHARRSVL
jgi:hypothetical protein